MTTDDAAVELDKTAPTETLTQKEQQKIVRTTWLLPAEHEHWRPMWHPPKRFWWWFALTIGVLMVGVMQLIIWRNGSLCRFTVAGVTITKQSTAMARTKLSALAEDYRLTLVDPNKSAHRYTLSDMGLSLNGKKTTDAVLAAQSRTPYFKKLAFWRTQTVPAAFNRDETKFALFIQTKATSVTIPATNATLQTSSGEPVVTAAKNGEGYTFPNAKKQIAASTERLTSARFVLTKMAVPAAVTDTDLAPIVKKIKALAQTPITITVEAQAFRPSAATITKWIEPVTSSALDAALEVNSGRVEAYLDSILAKYVHLPASQVVIQQPDGGTTVLVAGRDGTDVTNENSVITSLISHLRAGKAVNETLDISHKASSTVNVSSYDKWIRVDLTNKHMYAYEGGQLINDVPVTAGAPATPTVVGEYRIYAKTDYRDMRGRNADGSSYYQPDVRYVSYFYKDYAIHGNYWRPLSYFGAVNSSHGCVSATNDNAKWFWDWAPVGTPVVTHY